MRGIQRVPRVGDLDVGSAAYMDASAIRIDAESHAFIDSDAPAFTRSHFGRRVAVHRDAESAWRIVIPFAAFPRWEKPTAESSALAAAGLPVTDFIHYPLPWSRAVWGVANRNWLAGQLEDWLSERSRGPSWTMTALAWGATIAIGFPQLVTFALIFGISNIPPVHSALESLVDRSWIRFSRPGRFKRVRNQPGGGLDTVPGYLVHGDPPPKTTVKEKVVDYFADFMSERSRFPQLTINWALTIAAFMVRIPPDFILAINWGVCQVSTVHSGIEAVRMRSMDRFLRPTSFAQPKNAEYLFSSKERAVRGPSSTATEEAVTPAGVGATDLPPTGSTVSVGHAITAARQRYAGLRRTRIAGRRRAIVASGVTASQETPSAPTGPAPVLAAAQRGGDVELAI